MRGYVVERAGRFDAVIYERRDPISGRERRRWHPAGTNRDDADRLATVLAAHARTTETPIRLSVGGTSCTCGCLGSGSVSGRVRGTATAAMSSCT